MKDLTSALVLRRCEKLIFFSLPNPQEDLQGKEDLLEDFVDDGDGLRRNMWAWEEEGNEVQNLKKKQKYIMA